MKETGIPGAVAEPDENGNSTPAAQVEFSLPRIAEQFQDNGGGEASVFTNLVQEPEGLAAEAELPACDLRAPTPTALPTVKLSQYPTVSCRITPDGATTFSLQWNNQQSRNKLPELGVPLTPLSWRCAEFSNKIGMVRQF